MRGTSKVLALSSTLRTKDSICDMLGVGNYLDGEQTG
jgi:hypothetical protein